uniref:Chromosome partition protein Smc n=1 Tax=Candidatus Methanogaster sp. ANME-2c ERB4 TaxID=2759911 RepID=A0A7G9Y366_9EURY|nr:hypothetical protein MPGNBCFJ_00012 [Methanosarcinales archaeon ANME-2c ERB4]QNO41723.1 hypothetical protein NCFGOGHO_00001 [Methanosarcinales archaeon ANME-2c ERB4]QNO42062.1 hypothetical protein NIICAKKE_00012 [Methanosarcinales archaeon ANME-2c ERB4]QNO42291.1 hypothetical protein OEDCDHIP_00008 [Methanosarcinales archaeon ANME-2c ERB4]QNO42450.1 hypothetical protein LBOOMNCC_00003 [Methanosarcinales archaeon ANME-2c ERB4]
MTRHRTNTEAEDAAGDKQAAEKSAAPTTEELQKQIDDLKKQAEAKQQQLGMQAQQYQQQLQNVTAAAISTRGQIEQLTDILGEQMRERHQLEGMLRSLSLMLPQR